METINGKKIDELTHADWTALEHNREAERLRESVQDQIERCRRRLDDAESDLKKTHFSFTHSSGILGNSAVDLDTLAAKYSAVQGLAARMINSLQYDHRVANPGPGEGLVAFFKFIRVEGCGLPALPKILVYGYREPNRLRSRWALALGDREAVIMSVPHRSEAEERAKREATERGGLEVQIDEK
jgi:hypothetical protein